MGSDFAHGFEFTIELDCDGKFVDDVRYGSSARDWHGLGTYARASAANTVERIAVPGLIIHAASDPFVKILPETRAKIARNPNLKFFEAGDGGHCAFVASPNGYDGRWAEQQVVEYLTRFHG